MLENGQITVLNMRDILPNRFQPRIRFDEEKLNELADSIRKYGVIQPIVVRQIGTKYEIIAGERRFKASGLANKETIPAIILNLSDRDSEEIALLENIQREDLTPIEEAVSYKRILDIGYITQDKLAKQLGKSQSSIANKIRLLNLDDTVQDALLHGKISERHARSLLRLPNKADQEKLLNRIINERLTVKMTDKEIKNILDENNEGEEKNIKSTESFFSSGQEIEQLTLDKPQRRAVPVASHRIIKVSPPDDLNVNKKERGSNFMDIDKILAEAQDINTTPEDKPVNDIADLMKQNPTTVTSPLIQSTPDTENREMVQPSPNNKFVNFNMMTEANTSPMNDVSSVQPEVSFNSMFGQNPNMVQASQQSSMTNPAPMYEQGTTFEQNSQFMQQEPVVPTPQPMPAQTSEVPLMQPMPSNPIESQEIKVTPMVNSSESTNSLKPDLMNPNLGQQYTSISPQQPIITSQNVNMSNNIQSMQSESMSNIQPMMSSIEQPVSSIPTMNIPDSDIIEDSMSNDQGGITPIPTPVDNANSFKQVINLIRNCSAEIERLGYYIDVDEVDLDNSYQVTFKIDKE